MSIMLGPLAAIIMGIWAVMVAQSVGVTGPWVAISAGIGGLFGFVAHWYSPVPVHNGGFGMPPARWQQWGFTNEPRAEYEDPTMSEVWAAAVPLGFSFADEKDEDDEP